MAPANEITVKLVALDDFCAERGISSIDLLKLDMQGSELGALQGAGRMLPFIRVIQVESNFIPQYQQSAAFGDVDTYLRHRGWEFYNMYQLWRDRRSGRLVFANCLYVNSGDVAASGGALPSQC